MKLKVPPVIVFVVSAVLLRLIQSITSDFHLTIPFGQYIALFTLSAGIAIALAGVIEFSKHKTTVDPTKPGKASSMVTSGIYRYTRNPMYLGMVVVLFGGVIYYGNPFTILALLFLVWYLTQFQIKPEEEILKENFGKPYTDYMKRVGRWVYLAFQPSLSNEIDELHT